MLDFQYSINANFLASYSFLQAHDKNAICKKLDTLLYTCTNSGLTDFNLIMLDACEQVDLNSLQKDLELAFDEFAKIGQSFSLWYPPYLKQTIAKIDKKLILNSSATHMGQYLKNGISQVPKVELAKNFTIERVQSEKDLIDFSALIAKGWNMDKKPYEDFFLSQAGVLLDKNCPKHIYLGKEDGKACTCTEIFIDDATSSVGIYYVTTDINYRKKGYAKALQANLLHKHAGYKHYIVLSSPAEQILMNGLGFSNCEFWTECY